MHSSIIIIDQYYINNSTNYRMGYGTVSFYALVGQLALPDNIDNSLFIGLTDFVWAWTS